jgi:hypothetical protein
MLCERLSDSLFCFFVLLAPSRAKTPQPIAHYPFVNNSFPHLDIGSITPVNQARGSQLLFSACSMDQLHGQ